jgi:hypothetical protein
MRNRVEQGTFPVLAHASTWETKSMRILTAIALLMALSAVAFAKPDSVERSPRTLVNVDINIGSIEQKDAGAAGTMRERAYFEAPLPSFNAGFFHCHLKPFVFQKTRLAQTCP